MKKALTLTAFSLWILFSGFFAPGAFAYYTLNYTLDEGGSRLEFDKNNFSRAITFTAGNDTANNRYEIRQRLDSPLRNRDNPSVTIGDNFMVRGFRGSNRYGDLRIPSGDIVVRNNELVYVSDTAGDSDSFTLVYSIKDASTLTPGYYTGRVILVLNPVSSAASPVTRVVEVYVNIPNDGGNLSVTVAPEEGFSALVLKPSGNAGAGGISARAVVTINGFFNGPFKIMQMLPAPIQSQDGRMLDNSSIVFNIPDASKGVAVSGPVPLSSGMQTVYSSRPDGGADKGFVIVYSLADSLSLPAGNYRSRIQYLLESSGQKVNLGALDIEIRQDRIFEISVTPQEQKYNIEFTNLKPGEGPRTSEVVIGVKSNLGRPYQVVQNVLSEMVNSKGEKIPEEDFTLRTVSVDNTKGVLKAADKIPVGKGGQLLFVSDEDGSSDRFKVVYELVCPDNLAAGSYSSRITYTLAEI